MAGRKRDNKNQQALPPAGGTGTPPPPPEAKPSLGSKMGAVAPTPEQPVRVKGKWAPGVSGNPGGRPKDQAEVRELARSHAPEAIDTLVQIMRTSKSQVTRKLAADSLLDRAYGKPNQSLSNPDGGPLPLDTSTVLIAKLKAMAEELAKDGTAGTQVAPGSAGPVGGSVENGGANESAADRARRAPGDEP